MARPTHADSQRILSVLAEANEQLQVLAWLNEENLCQVSIHRDVLTQRLGPGLVAALITHLALLQDFDAENTKADGRLLNLLEEEDEASEAARAAARAFECSTEELFRRLLREPEALRVLQEQFVSGSSGASGFLVSMKEFRKLYLNKLMTPVEEELSRERELEEVTAKLSKSRTDETRWGEKLSKLRREKEYGKETMNDELQKIKGEIEKLRKDTADAKKNIQYQYNKQRQDTQNKFLSTVQQLKAEKAELKKQVNDKRTENKEIQDKLMSRRQKDQSGKVDKKIEDYDHAMDENSKHRDRELSQFEENKKALEMLEDHITQLRLEQERMATEEAREAQRRQDYENLWKQKNQAAEYVAAHWKGLKSRQDYEKLKKTKLKKKRRK